MSGVGGQAAIRRHAAFRVTFCHSGNCHHRRTMQTHLFPARRWLCALGLILLLAGQAWAQAPAQPPPTPEQRLEKVETDVKDAALAGHNAWMLTSSALVLFMTAPGLAMFYSGL